MKNKDIVDKEIETFKGAEIYYTIKNGHITKIEFVKNHATSIIEVYEQNNLFKILCFGDYKAYTFGQNWNKWYLDMIDTSNFAYNAEKLESGKAIRFDSDQFEKDLKEYLEEWKTQNKGNNSDEWFMENFGEDYDMALEEIEDYDKYDSYRFIEILDALCDILGDEDIYSNGFGEVYEEHFIVWMAIIRVTQKNFKENKDMNDCIHYFVV